MKSALLLTKHAVAFPRRVTYSIGITIKSNLFFSSTICFSWSASSAISGWGKKKVGRCKKVDIIQDQGNLRANEVVDMDVPNARYHRLVNLQWFIFLLVFLLGCRCVGKSFLVFTASSISHLTDGVQKMSFWDPSKEFHITCGVGMTSSGGETYGLVQSKRSRER